MVYYEKPMHKQRAYCAYPVLEGGLSVSERISEKVISLPMHPYLDIATQDHVIESVRLAVKA
jgi:dTDP-4-amino-4,6-dideoxygalactose transaminase